MSVDLNTARERGYGGDFASDFGRAPLTHSLQEWEMILFGDGGSGNGNITTTRCTTTRSRVGAN